MGDYRLSFTTVTALYCLFWFFISFPLRFGYIYGLGGEGNIENKGENKVERTSHTLKHCALSILGGNLAMFIGGIPYHFSVIVFLKDVGQLISFAITYSAIFSLIFLPALTFAFGPKGNFANLRVIYRFLRGV